MPALRSIALLAALGLAGAAAAQPAPPPPPGPAAWWSARVVVPEDRFDPLGRRRPGRNEVPPPIDNGVDPLMYRLWGLAPLQTQLVRTGDAILEVWARPSDTVRQTVARVTLRRDGRAFVQARVGLGCCTADIARRVDIDAPLPPESAARLQALKDDPMWSAPRFVAIDEGEGVVDDLCLGGVGYDLTLVTAGRSRHLRRACSPEVVGQVADALAALLSAPLGLDPRYDVLYARGADFAREREAYRGLLARGGRLKSAASDRPQAGAVLVAPESELPPDDALAPTESMAPTTPVGP